LTVSDTTNKYEDNGAKLSGPTNKIDIEVEGVKTRALLDSGSQVTLVRAELLTLIEQRKGWTADKWKERDCELKTQPVGASGTELGAEAVVSLHITVEQTGQEVVIPCFVLKSSKPVWQGMVHDCAMVLGTNAMVKYGLRTVHSDGAVVPPISLAESTGNTNEYMVQRVLISSFSTRHVTVG